jgi:hypothetical protein
MALPPSLALLGVASSAVIAVSTAAWSSASRPRSACAIFERTCSHASSTS